MAKYRPSERIANAVFYPTATAYVLLVPGFLKTGLVLYSAFIIASWLAGFFKRFMEWPLFAKVMLACGPPLLGLGYFFSTQNMTIGMFVPGIFYAVLSGVVRDVLRLVDSNG